jgi:DNA-binding SARP family transcriptional activator/predicted ATPase/CheY-like chemotaxis protein
MSLNIYTLGNLQLKHHGETVTGLVSNKTAVLLLYLAWHPYPHPREILADLFWHDTEAQQAMTNLRNALASLQKHLPEYLDVTRQTIGINRESAIWIDAQAFNQTIKAFKSANQERPKPSHKMIENLEQAVHLYNGDFLLGLNLRNSVDVENWMLAEQRHLKAVYVESLRHISAHYLHLGNDERAITLAKEIIAADPLWEPGQQLLMRALASSGRRHEAIQHYKLFAQLLAEELDVDPDEETTALYEVIKSGNLTSDVPSANQVFLPVARNFVGRQEEITQILNNLDSPNCRLISIVGMGGIGKTQLALEIAGRCTYDYLDGIHFLSPSPDSENNDLIQNVGSSLQLHHEDRMDQAIIRHFRDKHLLLILDNAELFLGNVGFLNELLRYAKHLKILVTSREILNIQGEWIIKLDGLPTPSLEVAVEEAKSYDSVLLFHSIASQVTQEFSLEKNLKAIIQICQLVGGSPLAIQIAAHWVQLLPPYQILENIQETLDFLSSSSRDIPERQRSIRAVLDNSWVLLSEPEQRILMSLSIFQGKFSQQAAEFIADTHLNDFSELASKSLILPYPQDHFVLHDFVRQYAYEKLLKSDLLEKVSFRHCEFFLQSLQKIKLLNQKNVLTFEELDTIYDDILHALLWTDQQHMIVFMCAVFQRQTWKVRQLFKDEVELNLIHYAQNKVYEGELHAVFLFCKADFLWIIGDAESAKTLLQENLAYCLQENWIDIALETLALLIEIEAFSENYVGALEHFQTLQHYKDHLSNQTLLSHVLYCIGAAFLGFKRGVSEFFSAQFYTLIQYPNYSVELYKTLAEFGVSHLSLEAIQLEDDYLSKAAEILLQRYYTYETVTLFSDFVQIGLLSEQFYQAERLLVDSLKISKQNKNSFQGIYALLGYANWQLLGGQHETAAILYGFIKKFSLTERAKKQIQNNERHLAAQLDPEAYAALNQQGAEMSLEEALQFATPHRQHVFIIDDDINDRNILGQLLELENISYSVAVSSQEALEKIEQLPELSAIFLDIKMPEVDGYSLFKLLKSHPQIHHIPIIAYTGNPQDAKKAYDMGFHSLLAKPINMNDFHRDLSQILEGNALW